MPTVPLEGDRAEVEQIVPWCTIDGVHSPFTQTTVGSAAREHAHRIAVGTDRPTLIQPIAREHLGHAGRETQPGGRAE